MTLEELNVEAEKVRKVRKAEIRKGVLGALLKIYDARGLAMLVTCPLCGHQIGEYTWTFTNFEKGLNPIGISGVQCSNEGCLLHNGIIYEVEGKRLAEWQGQLKDWVIKDFKGDEKSLKNPIVRGIDEVTKCPRCGAMNTRTPAEEGGERYKVTADGTAYVVEGYVCAKCGLYYVDTAQEEKKEDDE